MTITGQVTFASDLVTKPVAHRSSKSLLKKSPISLPSVPVYKTPGVSELAFAVFLCGESGKDYMPCQPLHPEMLSTYDEASKTASNQYFFDKGTFKALVYSDRYSAVCGARPVHTFYREVGDRPFQYLGAGKVRMAGVDCWKLEVKSAEGHACPPVDGDAVLGGLAHIGVNTSKFEKKLYNNPVYFVRCKAVPKFAAPTPPAAKAVTDFSVLPTLS
jgi:hypothetical protein